MEFCATCMARLFGSYLVLPLVFTSICAPYGPYITGILPTENVLRFLKVENYNNEAITPKKAVHPCPKGILTQCSQIMVYYQNK